MGKHNRSRRLVVCLRCQNMKRHEARGLCKCCYNHLAEHRCKAGESLADYPLLGSPETRDSHRRHHDPSFIPLREARKDHPIAQRSGKTRGANTHRTPIPGRHGETARSA